MNPTHLTPATGGPTVAISRVADHQWQALEDGRVVGRSDASNRPDGRLFISIDAWHAAAFDRLAAAMVADLPAPLHTLVDQSDLDSTSGWQRAGFTIGRREREYLIPTDPAVTGLGCTPPPSDVRIVPVGEAEQEPLCALDRVIRDEVEATVGWRRMPAEVLPLPVGATVVDPSKYAVAVRADRYVGMVRLAPLPRQPRIGLIAVRADEHHRGIARALLASVLGGLYLSGVASARAEVDESNDAALALFESVGAQSMGCNVELVHG
ncbi:GNAT family N-acetyltransferase [Streptomyces sp. ISL-66]|uniref:GNAT family N-acetyltransferase n=1 Tax=Streptomyces sp. ISL-66 TaxID=2819186 RepID=UPI001BEB3691|nr:GNAT family N-acetyltransferase [Streptomyces sp. ISL-66]MBT2470589.1 GNAT family N-acetyltransferase [Streptomyces sp. ISL-66]